MTFAHPQLLWLLLVPALLLLAALKPAVRKTATPAHPKIQRALLFPGALIMDRRSATPRPVVACVALAALALALARPQGATIATPAVTQARDVLVAVDVSRSMLADDVAPNRLARAQLLVRTLADELKGERIGLLPFAGTAFLQSPLSADYEIFRTFLDELGPDMIPVGGSDFTALLETAGEAFGPAEATAADAPPPADRYLVVLSDGEAQDETWKPVAQKLAGRGVRVLALGLGTSAGAMVPDGKGGLIKDERGAAVLSRLDASTLQGLARLTDGAYRDASAWVDLPALLRDTIARGRARETTTDTAPRREELFVWFLTPALALLAFSLVREFPATPRPRRVAVAKPPTRYASSLTLLLFVHCSLLIGHWTFAAEGGATPPPDPLVELVGKLAASPELPPAELARLATLTADQGEKARAAKGPAFPEGALRDALAATEQGRAAAPSAADWPALRSRLQALLAPPPEPPKPDKSQQDPSDKNKDDSKNDPSKSPQDSPDQKSDPKQQDKSKPENGKDGKNQDSSPESSSPSDSQSKPSPDSQSGKPAGTPSEKPLGDLGKKPGEESAKPDAEKDKADDKSASGSTPDQPPPEPTQRAGGVSASGQPQDGKSGDALAQLDPSLAVPQQRLERVRDSDSPARLYQLLQEAETPADAERRAAAGHTRNW